jgi:hypothetical protein
MPQVIVIADSAAEDGTAQVMFRERVTERDFESDHFAAQLAERLGWAVGDAHDIDHRVNQVKSRLQAADIAAHAGNGVSAETLQRSSARVVTTAS